MPPHKDFSKSKIYIIQPVGGLEYYIGATTSSLAKRMAWHKHKYNQGYIHCNTFKLFQKYGIEKCHIQLYEEYPCDNQNDLDFREAHWVKQLIKDPNCVNQRISKRTFEEKWKLKQQYDQKYRISGKKKISDQKFTKSDKGKEACKRREQIRKQKITCQHCGSTIRQDSIYKHTQSKKCQRFGGASILPANSS